MQPAWIGGPPVLARGGSSRDFHLAQAPPGLVATGPLRYDGNAKPVLPPGLPIRPPPTTNPVLPVAPAGLSQPPPHPPFPSSQNSQVFISSPLPQLPFPHRPFHPIYNSPSVPTQHAQTTLSLERTPSQPTAANPFPSSSIPSPPPPPNSFPGSAPPLGNPDVVYAPSPPKLPPNPPPPGAHSTFLTIAMSRKAATSKTGAFPLSPPAPRSPGSTSDPKPPLSRFAPLYVPRWLRQVNTLIPNLVFPLPPSIEHELYSSLISELYPPKLLSNLVQAEQDATSRIKQQLTLKANPSNLSIDFDSNDPKARFDVHPLSRSTYAAHWIPLQALEYNARQFELYESTLYNVTLRPYGNRSLSTFSTSSTVSNLFSLPTPFIRESWPPVSMGDTCFLRPLVPEIHGWKGVEIEAKVYAIERIKGEVVLSVDQQSRSWLRHLEETTRATEGGNRFDEPEERRGTENGDKEGRGEDLGIKINVIWKIQDRFFEDWKKATEVVDLHLQRAETDTTASSTLTGNKSASSPSSLSPTNGKTSKTARKRVPIESWLFPTEEDLPEDGAESATVPVLSGRRWVDANLNEEQKNAVQSILWAKHRAPLLISGPPGTGKTKTLVESVFQILKQYPDARVLVCGASNPSTDTLALRLRSLMPSQLLRLCHPNRPFNEVRGELLPFCHVDGEEFGIPDIATLLSKRVICTTVLDCSILLSSRLTNYGLASLEAHLESRLYPGPITPRSPHFDYLLIDEAGQATESDLLPALAVVLTDPTISTPAHVTICGDSNQLSPHIVSSTARDNDLDVSLLERLLRRPLYSEHPYSRKNRRRNPDATWNVETTPFVDLVRNYRSVEEILWLPSTLFYHESLLPCASQSIQQTLLRNWSLLPNPGFPMLFTNTGGEDFEVEEGSSFFNPSEILLVVSLCQNLVRDGKERGHGRVRAKDISVISPFREQVWRIRLALRKVGLGDVDVGNVEALQGAENRIVIVSPVRSTNTRWIEHDRRTNRGLIYEPKRFNVAMTRAKELLIVVGNAQTLTADPYWRAFYQLCLRNDCYVGPPVVFQQIEEDLSAAAQAVSKMEMEYHHRERKRDVGAHEANELDISVGRMVTLLDEGED